MLAHDAGHAGGLLRLVWAGAENPALLHRNARLIILTLEWGPLLACKSCACRRAVSLVCGQRVDVAYCIISGCKPGLMCHPTLPCM